MPERKQSLKPDRPLASIAFPKHGAPNLAIEDLPRTQKELELAVGKKFAGAMAHFRNEHLSGMLSGDCRGDLICSHPVLGKVKIQVVEVIDPVSTILNERRGSFRSDLTSSHADALALFFGCQLTLCDNGCAPFLPRAGTRAGKQCCSEIAAVLRTLGSEIQTLSLGKSRVVELIVGNDQVHLHVLCDRFAPPESGVPCQLAWSGGRVFQAGEARRFLTGAVTKKIGKHYSKPKETFWLLAYATDTLLVEGDPDIDSAAVLLSKEKHPFDAVWYLYPYENRELGHLIQVWDR
jgi:hypothetical protein